MITSVWERERREMDGNRISGAQVDNGGMLSDTDVTWTETVEGVLIVSKRII